MPILFGSNSRNFFECPSATAVLAVFLCVLKTPSFAVNVAPAVMLGGDALV
jgi:hypothetical protein